MESFSFQDEKLLQLCEDKAKLKCREQVGVIMDALLAPFERESHAPALFGCKMTGKTTIMQQAIVLLHDRGIRALYVDGEKCPSMDALTFVVRKALQEGIHHVFIDEVTQVKGFGEDCAILKGLDFQKSKFVFAGTHSLLLRDIYADNFVGWGPLVPTAPISYGEWSETHGIDVSVDEFLCNGGTMVRNFSKAEPDVQKYLFSSVGKNFEKTIEEIPNSELRSLTRIARLGFLPLAVNFTIKDIFHNLFRDDIDARLREFDSGDMKALSQLIAKNFLDKSVEEMEKMNKKLMDAYRARVGDNRFFREDAPELNAGSMGVIMNALLDVDFVREWPAKNFLLKEKGAIKKEHDLFLLTMPCVRYRLTIAAAEETRRIIGAFDFPEKDAVQDMLASDSYGSLGTLLEESLFLDMQRAGGSAWDVFKTRFFDRGGTRQRGEIDILAQEPDGKYVFLEVKHTKKPTHDDAKRLFDKVILETLKMNGIVPAARYLIANVDECSHENGYDIISAKTLLNGLWYKPKETLCRLLDGKMCDDLRR